MQICNSGNIAGQIFHRCTQLICLSMWPVTQTSKGLLVCSSGKLNTKVANWEGAPQPSHKFQPVASFCRRPSASRVASQLAS